MREGGKVYVGGGDAHGAAQSSLAQRPPTFQGFKHSTVRTPSPTFTPRPRARGTAFEIDLKKQPLHPSMHACVTQSLTHVTERYFAQCDPVRGPSVEREAE